MKAPGRRGDGSKIRTSYPILVSPGRRGVGSEIRTRDVRGPDSKASPTIEKPGLLSAPSLVFDTNKSSRWMGSTPVEGGTPPASPPISTLGPQSAEIPLYATAVHCHPPVPSGLHRAAMKSEEQPPCPLQPSVPRITPWLSSPGSSVPGGSSSGPPFSRSSSSGAVS